MRHLLLLANAKRIPLADKSVHCVVTSPPYFSLRDYQVEGQVGLEETPEKYIEVMVLIFREVWRVLRDDGTLWLNMGDSYLSGKGASKGVDRKNVARRFGCRPVDRPILGLKQKDLIGVPWMLAFALRADRWTLRSDVIWHKPNVMPESVRDRPSKAHEYLFLLTKGKKYFYDIDATGEVQKTLGKRHEGKSGYREEHPSKGGIRERKLNPLGSNRRSVWPVSTSPLKDAHFATMPVKLAIPCIQAGTSEKGCCPKCGDQWSRVVEKERVATRPGVATKVNGRDRVEIGNRDPQRHVTEVKTVGWESSCTCLEAKHPQPCRIFDPFGGAMTTVLAAEILGRVGVATELKPEYIEIGRRRLERPHAPKPKKSPKRPKEVYPLFRSDS